MMPLFVELLEFTAVIPDYFGSDEEYSKLQNFLADNPLTGATIQQTGGIRKMRWADPRRGKGKRSGLRVLYLYLPEYELFLMIDVYDKDEQDDLSPSQRKRLAELVSTYRTALERRAKNRE